MSDKPELPPEAQRMVEAIRRRGERRRRWFAEGEQSLIGYLGQIGVLGWMIVLPTLAGTLLGRWLDTTFDAGIFWTLPLMLLGLILGCWSGWRWMHRS